jgi:hypothetical protein
MKGSYVLKNGDAVILAQFSEIQKKIRVKVKLEADI